MREEPHLYPACASRVEAFPRLEMGPATPLTANRPELVAAAGPPDPYVNCASHTSDDALSPGSTGLATVVSIQKSVQSYNTTL